MLVYANSLLLNPDGGIKDAIVQIALWVGGPRSAVVDPQRLRTGIRDLRFSDGASLSSLATLDDQGNPAFPFFFNAKLMHGQPGVPGRRWVTEIGLSQATPDQDIQCSILLRTDDISAKVTDPIHVTRPRIVELLAGRCNPARDTPGLSVIHLTEGNATAFGYEIERETRRHPIVEVSCDREGRFPITSERLRSVLVGIAQVIEISAQANTYRIEEILGRRYSAFGGAINIIFPFRKTEEGGFCKTVLFKPDQIAEMVEAGVSIESEVLAAVTHQTNLPHSWRHISNDSVREAILRSRLRNAILAASGSPDSAAYEELLQEAADQLAAKDNDLTAARSEIEARDSTVDRVSSEKDALSFENEALKHSLTSAQLKVNTDTSEGGLSDELCEAIKAALDETSSLEQGLLIISKLYPERVRILQSAYSSANESDKGGFKFGAKALELLIELSDGYWSDLSAGKGDQQAKNRFGKNGFAAKEAESLSAEGRRRRTFRYKGGDITMEKHLKFGIKDSYAETLRVHFEWMPDEKIIVIGHCGKHLDF